MWYASLMLLTLWLWQDFAQQMTVKTIPYSDFKEQVRNQEVIECDVQDTEIVGLIRFATKETTRKPSRPSPLRDRRRNTDRYRAAG